MQARCPERESKNSLRLLEFSILLRVCHDRLGRSCIGREAHAHNRFKMAATYPSIKNYGFLATIGALTISLTVSDSPGHRSPFLFAFVITSIGVNDLCRVD